MGAERLDKVLANSCNLARSSVKELIKKGKVLVNGAAVRSNEFKVCEEDEIMLDGKRVNTSRFRYFMLNKPAGYLSATKDDKDPVVTELLKKENVRELHPVGRLDKDTVGLLIMTNDGELSHALLSPSHEVKKVYEAKVSGILLPEHKDAFERGFEFKDFTSKPALLEILESNEELEQGLARVTVCEGKFHEVKRLFAAVGVTVTALKRVAFGGLTLDDGLNEGEYRELTAGEVEILRKNSIG